MNRFYYLYINSEVSLKANTKPVAERMLKQILGLSPYSLWIHAQRLTRYHTKRYLIMEVTEKQHTALTAVMTNGGLHPLPELFTLTMGVTTLQIDSKAWTQEYNDGRNRGMAQPRTKQVNEDELSQLEGN